MGIMPHTDVAKALELALALDVPFWPQLPNVSFYEDMYAQASLGFPGIILDVGAEKVDFSSLKFEEDLAAYSERIDNPAYFELAERYSVSYQSFLNQDLRRYTAIRGQMTGPVSFGFRVVDENLRPIIYNEGVKDILFDFMQRKVNAQYQQLKARNPNAFVWVDEPGLGWVFSGLSGYDDLRAREDYHRFVEGLEGPPALHLCANVNLPYLLELGIELISFDAYQIQFMPKAYASSVAAFLKNGGVIAWGIVPTDSTNLTAQDAGSLEALLTGYWQIVADQTNLPLEQIARQSLIAPARCCLKNIGKVGSADDPEPGVETCPAFTNEEELVETAFGLVQEISDRLKAKFSLN